MPRCSLANAIFCQRRASIIEFLATHRSNSALYAGYASSVFGLDYWVVVSNSKDGSYDGITPADVRLVVENALGRRGHSGDAATRGRAAANWMLVQGNEESNLVSGYGSYVHGWPAGW